MKKITLIFIALVFFGFVFFASSCNQAAQRQAETDNECIELWGTLILRGGGSGFFLLCGNIEQLSVPAKTIIARFTTNICAWGLSEADNRSRLAQALGNFDTLEEARAVLLQNWTGEELSLPRTITELCLEKRDNRLLFRSCMGVHEFKIGKNGEITYLGTKLWLQ